MKKVKEVLLATAILAVLGVFAFAKTVGVTYTDALVIPYNGTQTAGITAAGALTVTSLVNTGGVTGTTGAFSSTLDADGQVTFGADGTVSTIPATGAAIFAASVTAPDLVATDDLDVTDDARITGLITVGETATIVGNSYFGAANYKSTNTASNGNWAFPAAVAIAGAVTGPTSVSAGAINISGSGQLLLGNATSEAIQALAPGQAKGAIIFNSTLSMICQSSSTAAGGWVASTNTAVACW